MDASLEKGEVLFVHNSVERPRRRAAVTEVLHLKIVITLAAVAFLLWKYSINIDARKSTHYETNIPKYVFDYAPLVWLDQEEQYFPSDLSVQIANTHAAINLTTIPTPPLSVHNLSYLNSYGRNGHNIYLTSDLDVTTSPSWLIGVVPDTKGKTNNATSCSVIVNDHGDGNVDAFYMYFYAYNLGNTVLYQELGDHVGDWEHNMVRFVNGTPQAMWFSQHANGEAFAYDVVEKQGKRPITYSARGSHANYAIVGTHDHAIPDFNLPVGFVQDYTSKGTLWDPILSAYTYTYNATSSSFFPVDSKSPVAAMDFKGKWGDEQYPKDDERQKVFFGFSKFVSGPTGPWSKQLQRDKICPDNGIPCFVRTKLGP